MNDLTKYFFDLLAISMGRERDFPVLDHDAWEHLFELAKKQSLLGVMMAGLDALPRKGGAPLKYYSRWALMTEDIEKKSQARLEAARSLYGRFADVGLRSCVLKGPSAAARYPVPSRRQSGDIDIWVEGGTEKVMSFLRGICPTRNIVYHHCDAKLVDGISVEVHFTPSWMNSYVLNRRFQRYCAQKQDGQFSNFDGSLGFAVTDPEFAAVFSIVHIWRHVMDEGVGLRQLMDLHYLLEDLDEDRRTAAAAQLRRLGLGRFTAAVMFTLREVFGLPEDRLLVLASQRGGAFLLDEILMAGNFGHFDTRIRRRGGESRGARTVRKFCRDTRFFGFCPRDVLAAPFFKLWQYCWRRRNGYL